jgi:hypothetical protein
MATPEFWRNLKKEFLALPTVGSEFRADRLSPFTGEVPPQRGPFPISCPNQSLKQQWDTLFKRGCDALSEI